MVLTVAAQLKDLLKSVPEKLKEFSQEEMIRPRAKGKWSRVQILGHLCDSAINNLTRFIQVQYLPEPLSIFPYNQDVWVTSQHYSDTAIDEVIILWASLNRSIIRVISNLPKDKIAQTCILPNGNRVTLEWLIEDYLQHMRHHLQQIFQEVKNTTVS
ncbi:DinB family protein [Bacillus sp. BRMEA1]|uniref:DinB family protein n=1 Tax=Neobacillus endophyticus TaxID=2738405 RepID=UPI0015634F88|nr:DinB family protein [Neobacillus endophyticus]NRD77105.1 DinB family protein [Neobacillus endophyticus]